MPKIVNTALKANVDGVHLSEFGLRKYFYSVRVVVEQHLKDW